MVSARLILQARELGPSRAAWGHRDTCSRQPWGWCEKHNAALSLHRVGGKNEYWEEQVQQWLTQVIGLAWTQWSQVFLFWKGATWAQKQHWKRPFRMGSKKPCQLRRFSHFMLPCPKAHSSNWGSNVFQKANTISLINFKTLKRSGLLFLALN